MEEAAIPTTKPAPPPLPTQKRKKWFYLLFILLTVFYTSKRIGSSTWYEEWFGTPRKPHPIPSLIKIGKEQHQKLVTSRSKNLRQAYEKYVELHGRLPPTGFDIWFYTSQQTRVCNLDSFPQLYNSLKPFWGLSPTELSTRIDEMSKGANIGRVKVREGKVIKFNDQDTNTRGTDSDARRAAEEMLEMIVGRFRVKLPDSDMMINGFDEPRVITSYSLRTELESLALADQVRRPVQETPVFKDLLANQTPYSLLRKTCPPNSPVARSSLSSSPGTRPSPSSNSLASFTTYPGSFLSSPALETSTFCYQPALESLHASLIKALTFNVAEGFWPVFSCSKLEGFSDILIPGWFYWFDLVEYDILEDVEWKAKTDQIFWRGANTGGRSIGLNWIGWLRSRFVSKLNRPAEWKHFDQILLSTGANSVFTTTLPTFTVNKVLTDVAFSAPDVHGTVESLNSQRAEPSFRFTGRVPFRENFKAKGVFDLDGTAYSGRFVALMRSKSAVFKSKLFIETFDSSLVPWFHYVPVSIRLTEIYNLLGYFFSVRNVIRQMIATGEVSLSLPQLKAAIEGVPHEAQLKQIAEQGTIWAKNCARKEDMASYMFLLTLEWSRLTAGDRATQNFVMGEYDGI